MRLGAYRRARSPAMVTVLLAVVAVTITVAVAYWMSGISGQATKFEKIELTYASCKSGVGPSPPPQPSAVPVKVLFLAHFDCSVFWVDQLWHPTH